MASNGIRAACRALLLAAVLVNSAQALTVTGAFTDVTDNLAGDDLWRVDYSVLGALPSFYGVNLIFSPTTFSDLQLVAPPPAADWIAAVTPPDGAAGFDGLLTLTALHDLPASNKAALSLTFVRLDGKLPSFLAQPFEVFDDGFAPVGDPGHVVPVPEPATWLMFAGGALALLWRERRRRFATPVPAAALAAA